MPDSKTGSRRSDTEPRVASSAHSGSNRKPLSFSVADPISVVEHGRTFHGYREGKYLLPNDAHEQDRLDLQHHLWRLAMGGELSWAPLRDLNEGARVLDVGTGTGIWAIEFAEAHPGAEVFGTDLSLIQPPKLPPNCQFFRQDSEDNWVFEKPFDYIHLRSMCTCFADNKGMMKKVLENLSPGGWVEYQDFSTDMVGEDQAAEEALQASEVMKFTRLIVAGAAAFGRDVQCAQYYKQWMTETGFVDVTSRQVLAPINPWPQDPKDRELGHFMAANASEAMEGLSLKMLQGAGMSIEEIYEFMPRVRRSVLDTTLHAYSPIYIVYGRKPLDSQA